MLPKQLKDSQRHQRQPKQVWFFPDALQDLKLAAAAKIDLNHALTIELFKEMLIPALRTQMMNLKTPLKTLNNSLTDCYTWATRLDHQHHKSHQAIERTKENVLKKPAPQFYFPQKERDPNVMDIDRLTFDEQTQLMKEG